jgi:Kef-type K+ transport system membrane component KefB
MEWGSEVVVTIGQSDLFLFTILLQLAVIITAARVGAWLFARIGQPQVVGEIAAGLLLGPSCFGRLCPSAWEALSFAGTNETLRVLSELGLIFLMFLVGLEFDPHHLRRLGRASVMVAVAGIVLPFTLGTALAWFIHPVVAAGIDRTGFVLFVGVALSITAIPVLARILFDLDLHRSAVGTLTLTAAAIDDAAGWMILAAVVAVIRGDFHAVQVVQTLAWTLGFIAALFVLVRPVLRHWLKRAMSVGEGELRMGPLALLIALALAAAMATDRIGIFAAFGPFLLGTLVADVGGFADAVRRRLRDFVTVFFLPIYFTYTGLRVDVGLFTGGTAWLVAGLFLLVACFGKIAGCLTAARLGGLSWRASVCVGVLMNTRGLVGLVAINIGRELGAIPTTVFSMLVLMALTTTFLSTPLLRLLRGTESELDHAAAAGQESGRPTAGRTDSESFLP